MIQKKDNIVQFKFCFKDISIHIKLKTFKFFNIFQTF